MFKKYLLSFLFLLFLVHPTFAAEKFSNLFVFGDSLSDEGNLASLPDYQFLNYPPYHHGFSNGPMAASLVADMLDLELKPSMHLVGLPTGTNYAVAAAKAVGENPIDLKTQIGAFLMAQQGVAPENGLYFMLIGGNDIREALQTLEQRREQYLRVKQTADAMEENLRILIQNGAKNFVVMNVPDVGSIPETHLIAQQQGKQYKKMARRLTRYYNREVAKRVRKLRKEFHHIKMITFDTFKTLEMIKKNHTAMGFTNLDTACFSSNTQTFAPDCDFNQFLFFDEIHPTNKVHERYARAIYAIIPEP